jgi:hypothetical protein
MRFCCLCAFLKLPLHNGKTMRRAHRLLGHQPGDAHAMTSGATHRQNTRRAGRGSLDFASPRPPHHHQGTVPFSRACAVKSNSSALSRKR